MRNINNYLLLKVRNVNIVRKINVLHMEEADNLCKKDARNCPELQNCLRNRNVEKCIQISHILLSRKSIKAVQFVNNKKLEIKYGLL